MLYFLERNFMKQYFSSFKALTKFEKGLWVSSLLVTLLSYALSFCLSGTGSLLNLITSLIGVTALIFVAKGMVLGQALCILFALLVMSSTLSSTFPRFLLSFEMKFLYSCMPLFFW